MEAIETKKVRGYTIEIHQDDNAESPREMCTFGTMLCGHRRYNLGDRQIRSQADIDVVLKRKDIKFLNLYLYDHSGITMSTSPFSCPWDSGQVGIIFCTHNDICKEFGIKHVGKKSISNAYKLMRQEVDTYDAFLKGEVYGYVVVDKKGDTVDSCWGFICADSKDMEYVRATAREAVPS